MAPEQINRKDFQVIQTQWREKSFHLVTFDHIDSALEYDEHLVRFDGNPQQPTAYFKALLTSRDDIYPIEYLKEPDFVIVEHDEKIDLGTYIHSFKNTWMASPVDIDDSPEMKEMEEKIRLKFEK